MARRTFRDDGPPASITIYPTLDGWRHTIITTLGGMICGRLAKIAADADPVTAKRGAADMVFRPRLGVLRPRS